MTDLVEFIEARLAEDKALATENGGAEWRAGDEVISEESTGSVVIAELYGYLGADGQHIARHDPARVLREVEAKRRILAEHKPRLQTVEWPHDQTGDGHGWTCPRCQNVENDAGDWHPPVGGAGEFPKDDFVTPYVLAPCLTLAVLASVWSDHPDYRSEWSPS